MPSPPLPPHLPCPHCSYNLHGLPTPRCPECGHSFNWPALLQAHQSAHPRLFEYRLSQFFPTLFSTLLPTRFFRTFTPYHTVRPKRLLLYWILVCLLTLPTLSPACIFAWTYRQDTLAQRTSLTTAFRQYAPKAQSDLLSYVNNVYPYPTLPLILSKTWQDPYSRQLIFFFTSFTLWPLPTLAILSIHRRSNIPQIARCIIYSLDAPAWLGLTYLLLTPFHHATHILSQYTPHLWLLLFLISTYRLTRAYSQYLKIPRAWLIIPSVQLIVVLLVIQLYDFLIRIPR